MRSRVLSGLGFRPVSNAVHNRPVSESSVARTLRRDYSGDADLIYSRLVLPLTGSVKDDMYEAALEDGTFVVYGPHAEAIHFLLQHENLLSLAPALFERYATPQALIAAINSARNTIHLRARSLTRGLASDMVSNIVCGNGHKVDWNEPKLHKQATLVISDITGNPYNVDKGIGPNRVTCLAYMYLGELAP